MAVDKSDLRPGYEASLVVYACNNCGTTIFVSKLCTTHYFCVSMACLYPEAM